MVPNIITILKGDDLRSTLADTALAGGLFVLLSDLAARLVIAPWELPIELITGTAGSVVFIGLILCRLRFGRRNPGLRGLLAALGVRRPAGAPSRGGQA